MLTMPACLPDLEMSQSVGHHYLGINVMTKPTAYSILPSAPAGLPGGELGTKSARTEI